MTLEVMFQNSRFKDRCAWDTGYQPPDVIDEGERLGEVLGDKNILFMCHHGTLVVADSVHLAFDEVSNISLTIIIDRSVFTLTLFILLLMRSVIYHGAMSLDLGGAANCI